MTETRVIAHTPVAARHPWPADCFVQGGATGAVMRGDGSVYRTAFVEAFPASPRTFLRGEGASIEEAEDACWATYQRVTACAHAAFDPAGYTNGGGRCTGCGMFRPDVFAPRPPDPGAPRPLIDRVFADHDVQAAMEIVELAARAHELPTAAEAGEDR